MSRVWWFFHILAVGTGVLTWYMALVLLVGRVLRGTRVRYEAAMEAQRHENAWLN